MPIITDKKGVLGPMVGLFIMEKVYPKRADLLTTVEDDRIALPTNAHFLTLPLKNTYVCNVT